MHDGAASVSARGLAALSDSHAPWLCGGTVGRMSETTAPTALDRLKADTARRAAERQAAVEAADLEAAEQLLERRSKTDLDLMILGDAGGLFRGVFRAPAPEIWKRWKAEMRSDQQRAVANQNLAIACMLWPGPDVLAAHAERRPALYDALGIALQTAAGAGDEALVQK